MTLAEKVAQLTSIWPGDQPRDSNVAPMQGNCRDPEEPFAELVRDGLGQLTRVFGTRPVPPADALRMLRDLQSQIVAASRFGIPAIVHEECLTGFAAWKATTFPTPLAWGAVVRPRAGAARWPRPSAPPCGRSASTRAWRPVLDVVRDPRWGRVEESIGEDPYLVGTIGTAYVRGLQSAGIARHPQALRRLLGLPGRAQLRPGGRRPPRGRRRAAGAVRDGHCAAGRGR